MHDAVRLLSSLLWALVLTVTMGLAAPAHAQTLEAPDEPAEWGEVDAEVLEADTYAPDSNATAVILSDYGDTSFRRNGRLAFERHRRVKLLSESAFDEWGTVTIPYYAGDDPERVDNIEAQTFVRSDDGTVQRHELDDDDIFVEEVSAEHNRVTFTLPNLQPGAVIEYQYRVRSYHPRYLRSWSFQDSEPTLYSEYEVRIPRVFDYAMMVQGAESFDEEEEEKTNFSSRLYADRKRWVMKEVPALREEPYMTTVEDYRAKIRFQLRSIRNLDGGVEQRFMTSWPEVAEELLESERLGKALEGQRAVNNQAGELTRDLDAPIDKARAMYDYVAQSIEWNDQESIYARTDLNDVLSRNSGSSAEMNLLLAAMLRWADIDVTPVLISTRTHGAPQPQHPFVRQFNALVLAVQIDDEIHLVDATNPHRPFGVLPPRALNGEGFYLHAESPQWIEIPYAPSYQRTLFVRGQLQPDGSIEATVNTRESGYSAVLHRTQFANADDAASFAEELLLDGSDSATLTDVEVSGYEDTSAELSVSSTVQVPSYARTAADYMYISPFLTDERSENPFQRDERQFPVDFTYPQHIEYTLSLQLPEGYDIEELPEDIQVQFMGDSGQFTRIMRLQNNLLSMRAVFTMRDPVVFPEQYDDLRSFYDRIATVHSEPVVLVKASEDVEGAPSNDMSEAASEGDASEDGEGADE